MSEEGEGVAFAVCVCPVLVVLLVPVFPVLGLLLVFLSMSILTVIIFMSILLVQRDINSNVVHDHRFILCWRFWDLMEAMRRQTLLRDAGTGHVCSMRTVYACAM